MADTSNLSTFLGDVANAIRTKKATSDPIPASDFDTEILSIEGGTDTSDATATEKDIALGKTAYISKGKVTGSGYLAENIYGGLDYSDKTFIVEKIGSAGNSPYPSTYIFGKLTIRYSYRPLMYIYFDGEFIGTYNAALNGSQKSVAVVYYDDEQYIFIVNNTPIYTTQFEAISVNFINKTITDLGEISTIDETADIKTNGVECILSTSSYLYRYQKDTNTFKKYQSLKSIFLNFTGNGFAIYNSSSNGYINNYIYDETSDTYQIISKQLNNVDGISFYGDKIFIDGNVYTLNLDLSIGNLIKENVYDNLNGQLFYWINDKYVIYNGTLYYWDNTDNVLTTYIPMNYATLTGYIINRDTITTTQYTFSHSEEVIGVKVNDRDFYFSNGPTDFHSSEVLFGKSVYTSGAEMIIGTMPNNGELNYTSSTEEQTIPAGYTSGGTIAAYPVTEEEYNTCLELTNQIMGNGGN